MKPVLASILAAQALLAAATDIYVSVDGSDTNTGDSEDNPFRTLSKAQKTVRGLTEDALLDDVNVHIAPGKYVLSAPLQFHALDSGNNGFAVNWIGSNATISGGLEVKGWTVGDDGVYSAEVPNNTQSRNLFVGGQAANYARRMINDRTAFTFTENGMSWSDPAYDWLMTTDGIDNAEVRFINSFTDRYAPIEAVRDRELIMKQHSWANQLIGYDMVSDPHDDFGVWVQNSRALLTEGGEFFLDSEVGKVYYMPLEGEDMDVVDAYLGIQETLLSIGGTYDDPSHHISFHGLEFVSLPNGQAHTTADCFPSGALDVAQATKSRLCRPTDRRIYWREHNMARVRSHTAGLVADAKCCANQRRQQHCLVRLHIQPARRRGHWYWKR